MALAKTPYVQTVNCTVALAKTPHKNNLILRRKKSTNRGSKGGKTTRPLGSKFAVSRPHSPRCSKTNPPWRSRLPAVRFVAARLSSSKVLIAVGSRRSARVCSRSCFHRPLHLPLPLGLIRRRRRLPLMLGLPLPHLPLPLLLWQCFGVFRTARRQLGG